MHQVIEVAFDIRVCRKINSSRVMDTAALQCERLDISVRTVRLHLSWLVSRVASSRVSGISKQKLPNTFQFWAFFFEKISHILKSCSDMLLSRLSTCYGTISRDTVQLEDLLGHGCESMFARGGGRMVSIVTMCHVRRTQMLCCWQQHAPSGNCQHCQQTRKTHILCLKTLLDDMYWSVCGGSMGLHGIPNRHTYNLAICTCILFECTFCALRSFVHNTLARVEELATTWSTAQSRPWYESACPSAWNARSKNLRSVPGGGPTTCNYTEKQCKAPQLPLRDTARGGTGCPCAPCFISTCWSRLSTALWLMTRLYPHRWLADCNW